MKLSQDLQISLNVAMQEAAHRQHEFTGVEHLLYALLHDEETAGLIRHAGGKVEQLKEELDKYLTEEVETMSGTQLSAPSPSMGFQRVIQRAALHVEGSGKKEIKAANVIVAIFAEPDSWAVHFLEDSGVTRVNVVSYISHGISQLDDEDHPRGLVSEGDDEEGEEQSGFERKAECLAY